MDRVRAAVFSSLGDRVVGARVLDLFAGTGAMGIEALSRGAVSSVFIEVRRSNAQCIERNLAKTKLGAGRQTPVLVLDALAYLERRAPADGFDLVFADPPYFDPVRQKIDFPSQLLASEKLRAAVAPGGLFILEKNPLAPCEIPESWELLKAKRYGITEICYLAAK